MNYLQINGEKFEGVEAVSLAYFLQAQPPADFLLLDCREVSLSALTELLNLVRTRYILYAYANREQKERLAALGHFDLTEIWDSADFIAQVDYMCSDLAQTQGFSASPDEAATIPDDFTGTVERRGRYSMKLSGEFPERTLALDYKRLVANWGKPIFVVPFRRFYNAPGRHLLSFDYEVTGDLKVLYVITTLDRSGNIIKVDEISEREYVFEAVAQSEYRCQVYLQGTGSVLLGKVWTYKYKYGQGYYQLGDERAVSTNGEYLHAYFIPGRRVEKLIVGFSGNLSELPHYERQTMARTDFPVLLFCDLRARGGAFQLGRQLSADYEKALMAKIDATLEQLGLTRQALIIAGWSMGSFPAMYYGMKMQAGHVIAAKPLLHLGKVTSDPKVIYRTEPSMIAAREYLMGRVRLEDNGQLDGIISRTLEASDVSQMTFYSFMMDNDELDRCEDFFEELAPRAKAVHTVQEGGFHADKIAEMGRWITTILDDLSAS